MIEFFRDTLDGPIYIVYVFVCIILIFACIGYLAEKRMNEKDKLLDINDSKKVNNTLVSNVSKTTVPNSNVSEVVKPEQLKEVDSVVVSATSNTDDDNLI